MIKTCLNGWWEFQPCTAVSSNEAVPADGWEEEKYLVPSIWTKSRFAVRKKGESVYREEPDRPFSEEDEYLFDVYGYPLHWSQSRSAWIRRQLNLPQKVAETRYALRFDAVAPRCRLFVNGTPVCDHEEAMLPLEADVTDLLQAGDNEIAVLVLDYGRDGLGRSLTPSGNMLTHEMSGIWQDVFLLQSPLVRIREVVVRTSTRSGRLTLQWEVENQTGRSVAAWLRARVAPWRQSDETPRLPDLSPVEMEIPAHARLAITQEVAWRDASWWSPWNPHLYMLHGDLSWDGGEGVDSHEQRFGFREVWVEGPHLMLNDAPIHLFSDWGHRMTSYYHTRAYVEKWFGMIKDANMNHTRLHTHPHPPLLLDVADEMGILVTGETAIHGSGDDQAADSPAFWDAATRHVERFVTRDRNHPCLILWSVENEMRWVRKQTRLVQERLPALRALFQRLDPTRPAYHEGDSSLWNEREQTILSRHYGKDCAGLGWWDRTQPLHSGEMCTYHYAGPNNTVQLGGDRVWENYDAIDWAAAQETAHIVEAGRTVGVSCFGPWNLSCHQNLRPYCTPFSLAYPDMTVPGVKPLLVKPHLSEFIFWESGKGYFPKGSFDIQRHAFRPFAVIDLSLRTGYRAGSMMTRTLHLVNDTPHPRTGTLQVTVMAQEGYREHVAVPVSVPRGGVSPVTVRLPLPMCGGVLPVSWTASFETSEGTCLDTWTRQIRVFADPSLTGQNVRIGVFGAETLHQALSELGCACEAVRSLEAPALSEVDVLVLAPDTVEAGSTQNLALQAYVRRGGRLLLLDQRVSLFPNLTLEDKPVRSLFLRNPSHPVFEGLTETDFSHWGDDAYAVMHTDACPVVRMYRKDGGRWMSCLLDGGEGSFGDGDLEHAALFEMREGDGLVLACQLRIAEKSPEIPAAWWLLRNLLLYAMRWQPEEAPEVHVVEGVPAETIPWLAEAARSGAHVVVRNPSADDVAAWAKETGVALTTECREGLYQAVKYGQDKLLAGLSNWDACGVETWCYAGQEAHNHTMATHCFRQTPGLVPLWVTPQRSGLKELFVDGGKSELLRAHTLSRFVDGPEADLRPQGVLQGYCRLGRGLLVFDFLAPALSRDRHERVRNRLLANLGHRVVENLLDSPFEGPCVPQDAARSAGYPEEMTCLASCPDEVGFEKLVACTRPSMERMATAPILDAGDWKPVRGEGGRFCCQPESGGGAVLFYTRLHSLQSRTSSASNLNIPNPEALTHLDLSGSGTAELILNGVSHGRMPLREGVGTVSDIPIELGYNHMLIRWEPDQPGAPLGMQWRNLMRKPETGFAFL